MNSSLIDTQLVVFLTDSWGSDDTILNNFLKTDDQKMAHLIPQNILRHESEYFIQAELTNDELTFLEYSSINFVPSKCKWFTVMDETVDGAYQVLS